MCVNKMIFKTASLYKDDSEVISLSFKSIWEIIVHLFKNGLKWRKNELR